MTIRPSQILCVSWDHEQPRTAAAGLVVCTSHADRVVQALSETPALHSALADRLTGSETSTPSGMPSGTRDPGISINHRVAQLRTDITNTVASWVDVGIRARSLTPPAPDLAARCKWLTNQADWYLSRPDWTRQFTSDMLENHRQARTHLDIHRPRMVTVAEHCPRPHCDGRLVARVQPAGSRLPAVIVCDASPIDDDGVPTHYWPVHAWRALRKALAKAAR